MVGSQFVMAAAFSMLTPIMPLFLPVLGVESEAAIDIWAGVLNGVTSLVAAFASPLWGQVADRHGRKLMLLRSSLAIGLFTALMGVAANVWQFFAFRALMGVFAGFSSAAIALVASQVPEERLGYALGWLSTGQLVGSLVGPLIGGALGRSDGQLPNSVLLHLGDDPAVSSSRLVCCGRALCGSAEGARQGINPQQPDSGREHAGP